MIIIRGEGRMEHNQNLETGPLSSPVITNEWNWTETKHMRNMIHSRSICNSNGNKW